MTDMDKLREIAYGCAGVGSGAVMRLAPDVVMPEAEIRAGVEQVLAEFTPEAHPDPVSWLEAARDTLKPLQEGRVGGFAITDAAAVNALIGIGHALIEQNQLMRALHERRERE